jgi:hypothetical protein
MTDIDPDVLTLARALVDTGFTSMAELEQWEGKDGLRGILPSRLN